MTPEQARALFNEHREPGDLAHYGEKAAVAAIMTLNKEGWHVGEVEIATTRGKQVVAGWINGNFSLDFRAFLDSNEYWQGGWTLTHLPSGYVVRRIFAELKVAQDYADALADMGDWSFSEPNQHVRLAPMASAVKTLAEKFAGVVIVGPVAGEIAPSNIPVVSVIA